MKRSNHNIHFLKFTNQQNTIHLGPLIINQNTCNWSQFYVAKQTYNTTSIYKLVGDCDIRVLKKLNVKQTYVTNITLLGLAMVNSSIGLLNPGGDNSYCGVRSCTGPYRWECSVCHRGITILPGSAAMRLLRFSPGGLVVAKG